MPSDGKPPLVLYEDDHLLAIHKPSGINTHKPDRFAQDGIYEWLQKQRPEWRKLAILHRLDKETSGVMVLGKTTLANKSLTEQFERGQVTKQYHFLTAAAPKAGETIVSTPIDGKNARTRFRVVEKAGSFTCIEAQPETGRTHQVRIHAAEAGFPILGDKEHGTADARVPRLMLHAWKLSFRHPQSGQSMELEAQTPASFQNSDPLAAAEEFRNTLVDESQTDCYRLISGAADCFPGLILDKFGNTLLLQRFVAGAAIPSSIERPGDRYALFLQERASGAKTKPALWRGNEPSSIVAKENGLHFIICMDQGFSPGLFLDQRENRRYLRAISAGREVLNCFAYTCSFSVASAAGGGKTTSLDLSKAYLDWGRENLRINHLNPDKHDFIYGDVFDWLKRFAKRSRQWDIVLLDPPSFGTTKKGKVFRAAKDYFELVGLAAKLVRRGGILFCSTNLRAISAEQFVTGIERTLRDEKRQISSMDFETQPFDFRVAEGDKPYLKTLWLALD